MLSRILRRVGALTIGALSASAAVAIGATSPLSAQTATTAHEFDGLHFRSVGPATMSGRVSSLAVYDANPAIYYVGTAHGGLWKTTSKGNLFTPLLQHEGLLSIGAVTMSQSNPDLVWVGTGEANNRQSTSWGDGVYKSTDGGATFTHMGLRDSKFIGRMVIDPSNNDVVFVAANGSLYGPGGERGVYRTKDAGATWQRVLFIDDATGATDIVMSPTDSKILFAATYQRQRSTCCMNGGGPGSGLHVSRDGGDTWRKVEGGYPTGSLGRIAVDIAPSRSNVVYSLVEAETTGNDGQTGLWRSDDTGATWTKVNSANPRPMYFSNLKIDPTNPENVYYAGVGLHVSHDGGKSVETDAARVTHDDVHAIWVDPRNSNHVLIGNDGGLAVSYDAAHTWQFVPNLPVGLFYHVSYDMETPFNVCGGMQDNYNWCGPSRSRLGAGIMNYDWFQVQGGDGFVAIPDPRDSRIVYSESQNGNMQRRDVTTGESRNIRPTAQNVYPAVPEDERFRFHWDAPLMISPNDPGALMSAANRVFRSTDRGDSWEVISPDLTGNGDRDTIVTMGLKGKDIKIARHDGVSSWPAIVSLAESQKRPGVIYAGTDDGTVSMTRDGGKSWTNITSRLPGFPKGAFVSEVVPSRFDAGTVYIAVDNHRENDFAPHAWMSTDFGATFRVITNGLAGEVVHTLTEDTRNADVLYVGAESGLFVSLDRGSNWRRLAANFPNVRVDEITIHPRDNAMLVASHGRSIWILDDLAPIQEYSAAQRVADATLFSVPTALQWKYKDDRNDEFWGHQSFIGENPPIEATMSVFVKRAPKSLVVRIARGGTVMRELDLAPDSSFVGIQTVCWDMRGTPITGAPAAGGGGGRGPGGGGGGGGGAGRASAIPGVPVPLPEAGYKASNPCAAPGGGGGFGGRGGNANVGPYVTPGDYTVQLVADGSVISTKPMRIVMDPEVRLTGQARVAYDGLLQELHERQQRGTNIAAKLTTLATQIATVQSRMDSTPKLPSDARKAFDALRTQFETVRVKFGVSEGRAPRPRNAAADDEEEEGEGTPRGGGFGGGAANNDNVLAKLANAKNAIGSIWESPSAATSGAATDASQQLEAAILEAEAVLTSARTLGTTLAPLNRTLGVP